MPGAPPGSSLLLDELFERGDERLLPELFASAASGKLKALAPRWYRDGRPPLRELLLAYVDDGCDRRGHRPLVKGLFKLAEAEGDDELVAHFLVAFDRLVRRRLVRKTTWDVVGQRAAFEWVLRDATGVPARSPKDERQDRQLGRFSQRTRQYLVRRAVRYLRRLGRKDPARYRAAAVRALALYEDCHLERPDQLLGSWGLVHLLYRGSAALFRSPRGIKVAEGHTLAELSPAPLYPGVWKESPGPLLALLVAARCRPVRSFAAALLSRDHADALGRLPVARLLPLLSSPHEEVQLVGLRALESSPELPRLPVADWIALLSVPSPAAVAGLSSLFARHVAPDRLTLDQAVALALAEAAPVAEQGLAIARAKEPASRPELETVLRLAAAPVPRVRAEAAGWLASLLDAHPEAHLEDVRDLVDSRFADVRSAGLKLAATAARYRDAAPLWEAMAESPYADVRAALVTELSARERALAERRLSPRAAAPPVLAPSGPGARLHLSSESLRSLWTSSLLAVQGGGRAKRLALRQVSERLAASPEEAGELVRLVALLLRSVRPAERRPALAALVRSAGQGGPVAAALAAHAPELVVEGA